MKYSFQAPSLLVASLLGVLVSASFCQGYFPANESTYLNFHIPTGLHLNHTYPHIISGFGRFGHGPAGSMVLPVKMLGGNDYTLCNDHYKQEVVIDQLNLPPDQGAPFILLVERGLCTFVRKVRIAQHLGAAAVLIGDTNDQLPNLGKDILFLDNDLGDHPTPDNSNHSQIDREYRMANDGSGGDIGIPSMMIGKKDYQTIKDLVRHKNNTGVVVAELAWQIPKYDWKVVMDLWSSPIDYRTKEFLASNFSAIARSLDLNEAHGNTHDNEHYNDQMNLMRYHERPILLDGKSIGCVGQSDIPGGPCYRLCTNGGRYCHASQHHTDGRDIVKEALRRLCIHKHYKSPKYYWDYIDHFSANCWHADDFANEKCVKDAYTKSNIEPDKVKECLSDSGDPEEDVSNALLEDSLTMQKNQGVYQSPTVKINHEVSPLIGWTGLTQRNVLIALCETFAYGEKPHVCYACMACGDPVACAKRSPMKCVMGDGEEKEDPDAHKEEHHHHKKHGRGHKVFRWFFGLFLVGGLCGGGYVYYKKRMDEGDGLGAYSLQDAFLSDTS